ncbi:hypothetical protein CAOG_009391 [Capsaspora owczarzaki ATCC 30864]|uniref:Transmembrane protein n=1 Tax=Capsaspora owczarzaki (strain ATCC 30864) TaxID=595528 RepID=A0A0D2U3H9_CAPO3|nr:hypothetical protein CAOG_009391 [Capsaspora owczarzaki ATCC 30864]
MHNPHRQSRFHVLRTLAHHRLDAFQHQPFVSTAEIAGCGKRGKKTKHKQIEKNKINNKIKKNRALAPNFFVFYSIVREYAAAYLCLLGGRGCVLFVHVNVRRACWQRGNAFEHYKQKPRNHVFLFLLFFFNILAVSYPTLRLLLAAAVGCHFWLPASAPMPERLLA